MAEPSPQASRSDGDPSPAGRLPHARGLLHKAAGDREALAALAGGGLLGAFEQAFARTVEAPFAVAVSSGSTALYGALMAADIGPGDEVVVSPYGWGQTVGAVLAVGATPVFADVDAVTGNLDPARAAECCGPRTRAVLVTHLFGQPADMTAFTALCRERGLFLISDAAQALGTRWAGRAVGAWGELACFSLGRGKLVTAGEGGVVTCRSPDLYERLLLCTQHPLRAHAEIESPALRASIGELAMSLRLAPLAAAVALDDLALLATRLTARRQHVEQLRRRIGPIPGLSLPDDPQGGRHAYHAFVGRCLGGGAAREQIKRRLETMGIGSTPGPVRTPLHLRPPFTAADGWQPKALAPALHHPSWREGACPIAERLCRCQELALSG